MRIAVIAAATMAVLLGGCQSQHDSSVQVGKRVGNEPMGFITRPIAGIGSIILGEGIVVKEIREVRTPEGFLQVQVGGFNESQWTKQFDYKPEWFDANGMTIDSVMSKWMPMSVPAKSEFHFAVVAPSPKATNYRIGTRLTQNTEKYN
jgi:uncharacterized protein YcfL